MRIAIWAAVSSPEQAKEDKISIEIQLQKGTEYIAAHAHTLTGKYVVPGKSRTKYISLYHAEKEIPQLHALLEAAQRHEFDVLFVYDLNRFRNLMRQIYDVLCDYGIQLYIYTHPREPVPPHQYTDEIKSAVGMIVDLSNIISRNELSNLQRHFKEKMPGRIARGLHASIGYVPYGYKRLHPNDTKHPFELDLTKSRIVIQMKDWYLEGASLKGIAKRLNDKKIPSPFGKQWSQPGVRSILTSPYYAGIVYFGLKRYQRDRRSGKKIVTPNPNPVYGKGKHKALWDEATHQQILKTVEERGRGYRGDHTERFTSLMRCWCGETLHLETRRKQNLQYWRCAIKNSGHFYLNHKNALKLILPAIVQAIQNAKDLKFPDPPQDNTEQLHQEIRELEKKKKKWMDVYESGQEDMPFDDIRQRLKDIQTSLDTVRGLLAKSSTMQLDHINIQNTLTRLSKMLHQLPEYYLTAPAPKVNADLRSIISHISFNKNKEFTIHWRGG